MPIIRLATVDDMRSITSQNVAEIPRLPHLYITTDEPDVMRSWGVARADGDGSIAVYERLHPGAIVAPCFVGQRASRGDLLYNDAELAADFLPLQG